jgi:uncharacterized SAM-binding protein YcdF (DUF218 family)
MELSPFFFALYKLVKYAVYPFTWFLLLTGLSTILAFMQTSWRQLQWTRVVTVCTLLLVFLSGSPIAARILVGSLEAQYPPFDASRAQRFDAIVVLGAGAVGQGTLRPEDGLSPLSLERTLCGVDLYTRGFGPKVLFAGAESNVFGQGPKEAHEMTRLALRLRVPQQAIVTEDRSRTTYENAVETKRLLGPASILLVTSASHIPRALALFHKQGMRVTPYPCGYLVEDRPGLGWKLNVFDLLPTEAALHANSLAVNEIVGSLVYAALGKL